MDLYTSLVNELDLFFETLSALEIAIFCLNLMLMIFAKKIVSTVYPESTNLKIKTNRVHVFRALNLISILAIAYYHTHAREGFNSLGFKLVLISLIVYFSFLLAHVLSFLIRQRYGRVREVDGNKRIIETYHTRLLSIISGVFIFVISLIAIIQVLEFESLLQAGGVIGFIGVFLALTQGAWAPDIFSGLIILNSRMVEEGDVIETSEGDTSIGIVYKTKIFHTEILNIINNHRIMVKNAKLRDMTIHNLSKFASAKGLRENIHFKIGYSVPVKKVKEMFMDAFQQSKEACELSIEYQYPLETAVFDTGDHAIEWVMYYYTKDVKNLIRNRQQFMEKVLEVSQAHGIDISTPLTHQVESTRVVKESG